MTLRSDAQRLQKILDNLTWDGYGLWLPGWLVTQTDVPPTLDEFREWLDENMR